MPERMTRLQFRAALELRARRTREERGLLLLEGTRLVRDALENGAPLEWIAIDEQRVDDVHGLEAECARRGIPLLSISGRDAERLSEVEHAQGIVAAARRVEAAVDEVLAAGGVITVAHGAADPGNLGTMLRSCDWFGCPSLLVAREGVDPGNPKTLRAAMGSSFRVRTARYERIDELVVRARARGFSVLAADARGSVAGALPAAPDVLLVLGGEAHGLPGEVLELADHVVAVPRRGGAESLNLAVAHGVLLAMLTAAGVPDAPRAADHP